LSLVSASTALTVSAPIAGTPSSGFEAHAPSPGREHAELALHVVQDVEDQAVLRPHRAGERGVLGGREQFGEFALAREEVVELRRDQRTGRIRLAAGFVRVAQFQHQPFLVRELVGGVRRIDLGELAVGPAHVQLIVVEGDGAADEIALETRGVVALRGDVQVFRLAFVHARGLRHRRAARPLLHHARVTGGGHAAFAEIGEDVHGVLVDPGQAALGFGAEEAAGHPLLGPEVEFARDIGVGTARRERDQAAHVFGLQAVGAVPDPVLLLGDVELVEVDHRFPLRIRLAVFLERRAPPEAALVRLVLPEVVVVVADLLDAGDLGVGIEDGADVGFELAEVGRLRELCFRLGVLLADPGDRLVVVHGLEPLIGIVRHGGLLLRGGSVGSEERSGGGGKPEGDSDDEANGRSLGHATAPRGDGAATLSRPHFGLPNRRQGGRINLRQSRCAFPRIGCRPGSTGTRARPSRARTGWQRPRRCS
jgi:hypothetical protein